MKKDKATIHDIARALNTTASTVSRALNGSPRISEEMRKAVQKTALKLNYNANHLAAALRNGKSKTVGIVVPTADRSFFASVIRGVEEIANRAGFSVVICQTHDSYLKETACIDALLKSRVDGIIISHGKETLDFRHLIRVKEQGVPLVMFDRSHDQVGVSQVVLDDHLGSYKAVEHLLHQGCKRIAHFTSTRNVSIYNERLRGYRDALLAHGLNFDPQLVVASDLQLEDGRRSMEQLLRGDIMPDALLSASALGAVGAMQILKERKIKVPDEVAIVAFSNEEYSSFIDPPITSVDQHSMSMGTSAAEVFLDEVNRTVNTYVPRTIVLRPELIIRESSLRNREGE